MARWPLLYCNLLGNADQNYSIIFWAYQCLCFQSSMTQNEDRHKNSVAESQKQDSDVTLAQRVETRISLIYE